MPHEGEEEEGIGHDHQWSTLSVDLPLETKQTVAHDSGRNAGRELNHPLIAGRQLKVFPVALSGTVSTTTQTRQLGTIESCQQLAPTHPPKLSPSLA